MMYPNHEELDLDSPQSQELEISFIISLLRSKGIIRVGCHQTCPSLQELEICLVHTGGQDAG